MTQGTRASPFSPHTTVDGDQHLREQKSGRDLRLLLLGLAWVILVAAGARGIMRYENRPGAAGEPRQQLPPDLRLTVDNHAFVLVMLAHPNCPCTRASLAELERLMVKATGKLAVFVLLHKPGASGGELRSSPTGVLAARIPGVSVLTDNRLVAEIFAGETSGQTLLYDPHGHLVYSGGITLSRGHEGGNTGADAVLDRVNGRSHTYLQLPAFGCPLKTPRLPRSGTD